MAAPTDTETLSHREANGVSMYPTAELCIPCCVAQLQEPITTYNTLKQGTPSQALPRKHHTRKQWNFHSIFSPSIS